MARSKDLFDDTTMSFGEHLEVLRYHLWRALIGLFICVIVSLFFGDKIIAVIRYPIDQALVRHGQGELNVDDNMGEFNLRDFWGFLTGTAEEDDEPDEQGDNETNGENDTPSDVDPDSEDLSQATIHIRRSDLIRALRDLSPEENPLPLDDLDHLDEQETVELQISAPWISQMRTEIDTVVDRQNKPVTLTVQEAFLAYLKVSIVSGFVIGSPWIFYQLWLFVAAGLYPNERKYVYRYLPMSLGLFLVGVVFCFFLVFPFVLTFLLGFNKMLGVVPQIRLSEWITFAIMLPVMFGLSFQLPLVMLFLERISIFQASDYREKRRLAVLGIAVISMLMTPADPGSMVMMMIPLLLLYELGIIMCGFTVAKTPFDAQSA